MANILVVGFTPKGLRYRLRAVPKVIRSVKKAMELLDLFTEERPEWGVTELAQALGLPKATVHGLLCSLVEGGVLHRLPSGRYRLGWRIPLLNRVLMESVPLRLEARPRMARLAELYGETVHLAVLERGRVLYLEKQQGNRAIQVNITGVGAYLYAHASALGKVLLSGLSEKEVIAVVRTHGLPALTPNTITTLEELLSELRGVRERGYAYFPMMAAIAHGTEELVKACAARLAALPPIKAYEPEPVRLPEPDAMAGRPVHITGGEGVYQVEGEWLLQVMRAVNFDDDEGLRYFERVLQSAGVIAALREAGASQGDTVSIYGFDFDFVD